MCNISSIPCKCSVLIFSDPLLPFATVVVERLCFHRCLSVHTGVYTPWQADTPSARQQTPLLPEMAAAADGIPTGMHSCLLYLLNIAFILLSSD